MTEIADVLILEFLSLLVVFMVSLNREKSLDAGYHPIVLIHRDADWDMLSSAECAGDRNAL